MNELFDFLWWVVASIVVPLYLLVIGFVFTFVLRSAWRRADSHVDIDNMTKAYDIIRNRKNNSDGVDNNG